MFVCNESKSEGLKSEKSEEIPPFYETSFHTSRLNEEEIFELNQKIQSLSPHSLTFVFKILQKECPMAINDFDEDHLQIIVDNIDRNCFQNINK
jgi:hypothetical protein